MCPPKFIQLSIIRITDINALLPRYKIPSNNGNMYNNDKLHNVMNLYRFSTYDVHDLRSYGEIINKFV